MSEVKRFDGKVALITASTAGKSNINAASEAQRLLLRCGIFYLIPCLAGIGLGIAQRLGREGAKLVICSRKKVSHFQMSSKHLPGSKQRRSEVRPMQVALINH